MDCYGVLQGPLQTSLCKETSADGVGKAQSCLEFQHML